jgi:hypothetical protein
LTRRPRTSSPRRRPGGRRGTLDRPPLLERLETRDLPSGFHPFYVLRPHGGARHFSTAGPTGTTPAQIRHAYGFDRISFNGGTVAGDGSGTTIAIVDAYDDPTIASDLHQFDAQFGLPDPAFTKVNQDGGTTLPSADPNWSIEISLDVEWAHAIAPRANILLVEANDNSFTNLFAAVRYAAAQPGILAVSLSWGGSEFSGEPAADSTFTTPAGHPGVTFVVSSGDTGAPVSYPAASPNVLTAGGTTLRLDTSGNVLSETGWSGSGGGLSAYEGQPGYQYGVVTQTGTARTNPDVAYDADPNTGFPVCDSYTYGTSAPWIQLGGTSDAAPQWAALVAIADQGRALGGLGSLDGPTQTLPALYGLSAGDFHDVTSGTSTGSPNYSAGPGYDLVTGRGSPAADRVVADLVSYRGGADWSQWANMAGQGSAVAAGRNADGSRQVFAVGLDGSLWVRTQDGGGTWGGWTDLGGTCHGLAVTANAEGLQDVYVLGGDGAVWTRSETAPGQWAGWADLGGSGTSLAAGANADGSEQVFAVGGGALWTRTETAPGQWTAWADLGGVGGAPSVSRNGNGLLDVFVLGGDGAVWTRSETAPGQWAGWASLGGSCTSLAAGTNADGSEQVFAVGSGGALWTRTETAPGQWTAWADLGGSGGSPTVAGNSSGLLDVFTPGTDGAVWTRSETAPGQWTAWAGLGGSAASLAVTSDSSGRLEVFAAAPDEVIWGRTQTSAGTWG